MTQICNIKVSFTIKKDKKWYEKIKDVCVKNKKNLKKSGNITTFKYIFSFCFFEKKTEYIHVNATGIKKEEDIPNFKIFFYNNILKEEIHNFKIDNITASFSINKDLNLNTIFNSFENVKYNPERFPGLFLKHNSSTAVIFRNGKINILGCKNSKDVYLTWIKILQQISTALIP